MSGAYGNGLPGEFHGSWSEADDLRDAPLKRVCSDPVGRAFARAFACTLKRVRLNVNLPPNIFQPDHATPFVVEDKCILVSQNPAVTSANQALIGTAATAAGQADQCRVVSETSTGFKRMASFVVPPNHVAIVRTWAFQTDPLGYDILTTTVGSIQTAVQVKLTLEKGRTLQDPSQLGFVGNFDTPFDVSFVIGPNSRVSVDAFNNDPVTWHLIESYIKGYVIPTNMANEELSGISEGCR